MKAFRVLAAGLIAAAITIGGTFGVASAHRLGQDNTPGYEQIGNHFYCASGALLVSVETWAPTTYGEQDVTVKINLNGSQAVSTGAALGLNYTVYTNLEVDNYTSGYSTVVFPDGHTLKANFPTAPPISC
jgi:hypothetical protein